MEKKLMKLLDLPFSVIASCLVLIATLLAIVLTALLAVIQNITGLHPNISFIIIAVTVPVLVLLNYLITKK